MATPTAGTNFPNMFLPFLLGGGAGLFGGGLAGDSGPDFEEYMQTIVDVFGPGGSFSQKSGQVPSGGATESSGGGVGYDNFKYGDFGAVNKGKLLKNILAGKFGKKAGLDEATKAKAQEIVKADSAKVDINALREIAPGLVNRFHKRGGVNQIETRPKFAASPQAQGGYDAIQGQYFKDLFGPGGQNSVNDIIKMTLLPNLLKFQNTAVGGAQKIIEGGMNAIDPAIEAKIKVAKQAYIDSSSRGLTDKYRDITDRIYLGTGGGGFIGPGFSDRLSREVNKPLAEELGNITNLAELYGQDETHKTLADIRASLATIGGVAPGFNASLQGLNAPSVGDRANPYLLNPTGLFSPEMMLQALQYGNTFSQNADQIRRQPGIAGIGPGTAVASQPGTLQSVGNLAGQLIPNIIALQAIKSDPMRQYYANLNSKA